MEYHMIVGCEVSSLGEKYAGRDVEDWVNGQPKFRDCEMVYYKPYYCAPEQDCMIGYKVSEPYQLTDEWVQLVTACMDELNTKYDTCVSLLATGSVS